MYVKENTDPHEVKLVEAAKNGELELVKLLLSQGVNANGSNKWLETGLHHSAKHGYKDIVELLIENGADVNALDNQEYSVMYFASKYGRSEIVKLLIENGADPSVKTQKGLTPLDFAIEGQHPKVVLELVKNRVDDSINLDNLLYLAEYTGCDELLSWVTVKKGENVKGCRRRTTVVIQKQEEETDNSQANVQTDAHGQSNEEILVDNGGEINIIGNDSPCFCICIGYFMAYFYHGDI